MSMGVLAALHSTTTSEAQTSSEHPMQLLNTKQQNKKRNRSQFDAVRNDIMEEYLQDHNCPWIIGYSGGKDSTLVLHLVFEILMSLPPSRRTRDIHVVANDTLVESPMVIQHLRDSILEVGEAARAFGLPVTTKITQPRIDQSFWVNVIGRGYPPPNRTFRWCTDRMKIQPTSDYIRSQVDAAGQVILLLGVRRSESASRAASVGRYDTEGRLHPHNDLAGCMVYRPIVELDTEAVWDYLSSNDPPWGSSHLKLIGLYRHASGGECPMVTQKSDAPSCGTSSSRFGCWTCTVVEKDRSLEGFVEAGFSEFGPFLEFRDWLASIRNDKERRQARRRDGRVTITDTGIFVPGPFTLKTREELLNRLRQLECDLGYPVISDEEVALIYDLWAQEIARQTVVGNMSVREIKTER